jgi:hypothetical protein
MRRLGTRWGRPRPVVACPWPAARRDRKASWLFLNLLRALLEAHSEMRRIHVILDNFILHKGRVTRA